MNWASFWLGATVSGCVGFCINYALHCRQQKELKYYLAKHIEHENEHKQFVADVSKSLEEKDRFHF